MFGYPFMYPMPQPSNMNQPKSLKEQIEDQEALIEFVKKKFVKEEPKKETKLKDRKFSLWEGGLIMAVFSFTCAVPIVTYQLYSIHNLFETMGTMLK